MHCKNMLKLCLTAILLMVMALPAQVWSLTIETPIWANSDYAQEKDDGTIATGKDQKEEFGTRTIGLRFYPIYVPPASNITNAYIQFQADGNNPGPLTLTIHGQDSDDAPTFEDNDYNISSRPPTTASAVWIVPDFSKDQKYETPALTDIVQEIVNRDGGGVTAGWQLGQAMAFVFSGTGDDRKFKEFGPSKDQKSLALLHIEYESDSGMFQASGAEDEANEKDDETVELYKDEFKLGEKSVGLRFPDISVPTGSIIKSAFIEFTAKSGKDQKDATSLIIKAQKGADPPAFTDTQANITNRETISQTVNWDNLVEWKEDQKHRTPDISALVQELVGQSSWSAGQAMVFILSGTGKREAVTYFKQPSNAPVLFLDYEALDAPMISVDKNELGVVIYQGDAAENGAFTVTNTGVGTLNFTISKDDTWFSCTPVSGALGAGASQTITVTYNLASLPVGIHEARITVSDPNSSNKSVEINVSVTVLAVAVEQAVVDEAACSDPPLYTENQISPAILVLLDVSGSMGWKIEVATQLDPVTPDVSQIVQEIIDLPTWSSGYPMSFIISGSGKRTAKSYEGSNGSAPLLHVTYREAGLKQTVNFRVAHGSDDAEQRVSDGHMDLDSTDIEMINDNHNQIVGLRFRNVTIPPGAVIETAYLKFVADESDSQATHLTIHGENRTYPPIFAATNYDISNRPTTINSVPWNITEDWTAPTTQRRIDVGRVAISELMTDPGIAWGFGTWTTQSKSGYTADVDYTKIHAGCKLYNDDHQQALQTAIAAAQALSNTPLSPALIAARKYFAGQKKDKDGVAAGELFTAADCQPKFLILVTDGLGNTGTTLENVEQYSNELADEGVTTIVLGFGIDDAVQIQKIAAVSNQRAHAASTDVPLSEKLFALHEEVSGVGQPFLANSREELVRALGNITERIKNSVKFYGSAPAPVTSTDLGDTLIISKYDTLDWSGDVDRVTKSTSGQWNNLVWRASEAMAAMTSSRKIFSVADDHTSVKNITAAFETATNCKAFGDIINSTPTVIGAPPFYYPFDNYSNWRRSVVRDAMIYIGANDGALHALSLDTGEEKWAFVPDNLQFKLDQGNTDPKFDQCSGEYCHQYFVDGSPTVGDIYVDDAFETTWKTLLVCGERKGGSAVFALDITSGKPLDDVNDPTRYLWQFTDAELGQTWSDPAIARVLDTTATCTDAGGQTINCTTWGVFFGSGYSSTDQQDKKAYLFGMAANDKADLWQVAGGTNTRIPLTPATLAYDEKLNDFAVGGNISGSPSGATATVVAVQETDSVSGMLKLDQVNGTFQNNDNLTGSGGHAKVNGTLNDPLTNDAMASPLAVDFEADYVVDSLYAGNLYGSLFRVRNIGKGQNPEVSRLFDFDPARTNVDVNPIRALATYAYGSEGVDAVWIYFGTGRYEIQSDKVNKNPQYFFGLKDSKSTPATYVWNPSAAHPDIEILEAKYFNDPDRGMLRYIDGANASNKSWAIKLDASAGLSGSERVIEKAVVAGGVVLFTTFIPESDVCKGGGKTWAFAVNYHSGLATTETIFDINGDGKFDDQDKVTINGQLVNVAGIPVGSGKGSFPVLHKSTLYIATSGSGSTGGQVRGIRVNLPDARVSLNAWRNN